GYRKCDVVIAHMRRGLEIYHRNAGCRVGRGRRAEGDAATLQAILRSIEVSLTFEDIGPPQQHRLGGVASYSQIGITTKPKHAGLHLQIRCSHHVEIEPDVVEYRVGLRQTRLLNGASKICSEIKSRRDSKSRYCDVAGEQGSTGTPIPAQGCGCS